MPPIAQHGGAAQGIGMVAADQQRQRQRRLGLEQDAPVADPSSPIGQLALVLEHLADDSQVFLGHGGAIGKGRRAQRCELTLQPADAEPELEAPARKQ
jgi:hypothetical protein